jgi:hypothetical protein
VSRAEVSDGSRSESIRKGFEQLFTIQQLQNTVQPLNSWQDVFTGSALIGSAAGRAGFQPFGQAQAVEMRVSSLDLIARGRTAKIMQQNAVLKCLDGSPATMDNHSSIAFPCWLLVRQEAVEVVTDYRRASESALACDNSTAFGITR